MYRETQQDYDAKERRIPGSFLPPIGEGNLPSVHKRRFRAGFIHFESVSTLKKGRVLFLKKHFQAAYLFLDNTSARTDNKTMVPSYLPADS